MIILNNLLSLIKFISCLGRSQRKEKSHDRGHPPRYAATSAHTAAMEPRRSDRIKISNEGDFGVLLGALIRELPDVFEAEVLTKLSVKDHLALAQVNKECRDVVYKIPPLQFLRTILDNRDEAWREQMSRFHDERQASRILRYHEAVATGRLDVLEWLLDHGEVIPHELSVGYVAGLHGQKEVIEWSSEIPSRVQYPDKTREDAMRGAAKGGHLELVKHLREKGYDWDENTCASAAHEGHVHVLEYLRTNGCPWGSDAGFRAAEGDRLDTLKWLREHGCPWDEEVTGAAAENGHFETLKWLHEHGCPGWDAVLFATAVSGGNLEMIMWMHENGCPWDEEATVYAAIYGNLEILKWLHENGCPISDEACSEALDSEAWDCLKYLVDNKCPGYANYLK